jgi:antitoxin VapB
MSAASNDREGLLRVMDTAELFDDGHGQAVRLPKGYEFPGDQVLVKQVGNAIIVLPATGAWQALDESLALFSDDFMDRREQPSQPPREDLFD